MLSRIRIRPRITAAFAAVMTVLLVGIGAIAYHAMSAALLDEIDSGLRFRAAAIASAAPTGAVELPDTRLEEPDEAVSQVVSRAGVVLRATDGFAATPLLSRTELSTLTHPTFYQRHVAGIPDQTRLLAVPLTGPPSPSVLIVATTMSDRTDALGHLLVVFGIGGPIAIALACLAGWIVAGWGLRPVERMRRQASAITVSGLDRSLTVPPARDELRKLAETLNDMLERLGASLSRERAFLERASHELRTPLAALRAELDLALRRERTTSELAAAVQSASQETDRLARLADDLLVLARAEGGRLPVHREQVSLHESLESAASLFAARALGQQVTITVDAPDRDIDVDPARLRQALVNLLDNALRHTPPGGAVNLAATVTDTEVRIAVTDSGPGFPADQRGDGAPLSDGLGLRIVSAIAASHGGSVHIGSAPRHGAVVTVVLTA